METANCLCRRYNPAALIGELDSFFLSVLKPEMPTLCTTDFSDWSSVVPYLLKVLFRSKEGESRSKGIQMKHATLILFL